MFSPFFFILHMITVKDFLQTYCQEKELPPPTKSDLEHCGRMISYHFKNFWAKELFEGLIPDFGFIVTLEDDKKIVIQSYPDTFKSEMAKRIDLYYHKKSLPEKPIVKEVSAPEIPVKKRKRIAPKPTKEISVKPSKIK